jgi:transposase
MPGSGHYPTPERLKAAVIQVMRQRLARGQHLTQAEVAFHLSRRISERWLRTLLKKYRLSWDELRREAGQDPPLTRYELSSFFVPLSTA